MPSRIGGRLFLLGILLGSLALRSSWLDSQSFWDDEVLSVLHSRVPLATIIPALPPDHVPGYWFLLHFWLSLTGDVDFSVRYLSVFFGTAGVALVYVLGRRLYSPRVGLAAALLAAFNPFAVYFSQEARMYSLLFVCATAALYWFARAFQAPQRRINWVAHSVLLAVGFYTHYYALALPLAEAVFLVLERNGRRRERLVPWAASCAGAGVLFLPWAPWMARLFITRQWPPPVDTLTFPAQLWSNFFAGATMPESALPLLLALALALLAAGIASAAHRWQGRLLISFLLVPFLVMLAAVTLRRQGIFPRYLIIVLPPFLALAALALIGIDRRGQGPIRQLLAAITITGWLAIAGLSLYNYWFDPHYSRPDWRDAARWLAAREMPGDLILFDGADPQVSFARYFGGQSRRDLLPSFNPDTPASRIDERIQRLTAGAGRVWLVLFFHEPGPGENWLNAHGYQGDYEEFAGVYVFPYLLKPQLDQRARPPISLRQGGQIALSTCQVGTARPGSLLPVSLLWHNGTEPLDTDLQVSLRLVDSRGQIMTSLDRAPRGGFYPAPEWKPDEMVEDHYALSLPAKLPAAAFTLQVVLYDPAGGPPQLEATCGEVSVVPTP